MNTCQIQQTTKTLKFVPANNSSQVYSIFCLASHNLPTSIGAKLLIGKLDYCLIVDEPNAKKWDVCIHLLQIFSNCEASHKHCNNRLLMLVAFNRNRESWQLYAGINLISYRTKYIRTNILPSLCFSIFFNLEREGPNTIRGPFSGLWSSPVQQLIKSEVLMTTTYHLLQWLSQSTSRVYGMISFSFSAKPNN